MSFMIGSGLVIRPDKPVYVDANILIYAMETDGEEGMLARRWLMQIERGRVLAVTSELTAVEVIAEPMGKGDEKLVEGYRGLLSNRPTWRIAPVSSEVLVLATEIRARLRADTPDAIHVATAILSGRAGLLTNDGRLRLPQELIRYGLADVMSLY